jgi:hypothetical protein
MYDSHVMMLTNHIHDNADLNVGPDKNSIDGAKCSDDVGVKVVHLHFS